MRQRSSKLSSAVVRCLQSAELYGRADGHIEGRSAHGGYANTRTVLLRNGWINPFTEAATDAGRAALAEHKKGSRHDRNS